MKRLIFAFAFALATLSLAAQTETNEEQTLAFPGAEGFGRYTSGGRGGKVYHVTSLLDDGSKGTFRWACNQSGARTVVFDVSGTIYLTSSLSLQGDNVTIAGQSAPGDGICIADYPFTIHANNVIIRYMRFRLGNRHVADHEGDGLGGMDRENIIIDHCSVSWSVDECLSVYGSRNITVQWCIADQSMVNSGHSKGAHGYGGNWGGSEASYHHNLMAHHTSRTPRFGPRPGTQTDERMDFRNNVIYNWGGNGCYGGEGMKVNMINNYYKPGPATDKRSSTIKRRLTALGIRTSSYTGHDTSSPNAWDVMWHVWGKLYVEGNVNPDFSDVTNDNWTYGIYNQIDASGNDGTYTQATKDTIKLTEPLDVPYTTTQKAEIAYERVLDYAGASLHRDSHDEQIVNDARNRKATYTGKNLDPGFVNSQDDNKPANAGSDWCAWPTLSYTEAQAVRIYDADGDGIPGSKEDAWGMDDNDPTDANKIWKDGYTYLERYLNNLVAKITTAQNDMGEEEGIEEVREDVRNSEFANGVKTYTIQGIPIRETAKGFYIQQGRKSAIAH